MASTITVFSRGPLFDGVAEAELAVAMVAAQAEVASYAEWQWQMNMTEAFKHPSSPPHYQSKINVAKRGLDLVVNDGWPGSGVVYGPWLEGLGSRNATTRFKGYSSMRRAAGSVQQKVPAIVQPVVDKFIAKANGV